MAVLARSDLVRRAQKRGVRPLPFHATRHTYASLAIEAGRTLPWVAEQRGHADPASLRACPAAPGGGPVVCQLRHTEESPRRPYAAPPVGGSWRRFRANRKNQGITITSLVGAVGLEPTTFGSQSRGSGSKTRAVSATSGACESRSGSRWPALAGIPPTNPPYRCRLSLPA